jgi:hypothetical protein
MPAHGDQLRQPRTESLSSRLFSRDTPLALRTTSMFWSTPPLRNRRELRTSASSSSRTPGLVDTSLPLLSGIDAQIEFTDIIGQYTNYNQNTNSRMRNAADSSFVAANKNGFNSIIEWVTIRSFPCSILTCF